MKFKYLILVSATVLLTAISVYSESTSQNTWFMVESIIDGDTIRIHYNGKNTKVRLFGIDAPEHEEKGYFDAGALLEKLCYKQYVRLEFPGSNHRDKYNRLLAKVYLKDGRMLNEELFKSGVVKLYKKSPLF